ncbi:MAG: hypothetical protein EOO16_06590 [Chitinophagaceae bacterium]|nr:MAG: hypothetical protein EOO16_06590 [Chitinophagaceae bacterium]
MIQSSALIARKSLPFLALFFSAALHAQTTVVEGPTGNPPRARAIAGEKYRAGGFKKTFMGRHYREEWITPVWVPVLRMDTLGGLSVVEAGGGKQTFSLRLKDGQGRQWALRSVDKNNSTVIPEIARGTFIDKAAQDIVSSAHPYAAVSIPLMAEAAGVYHTRPRFVLAPDDPAFGEYRAQVAGRLFLMEERPDDMKEGIENFGNATEIIGTEKLSEYLATRPNHRVDQEAYVRARLFDMFIGDWDRHEDQWRWARFKEGNETVYRPIPRDRDQVYALFQGVIPYLLTLPEELEVLESFRGDIKNVKKFNQSARYIDRQLANEVPVTRWIEIARDLEAKLTDGVIEQSVRQLPPEIFAESGETIIKKLKSRRGHLLEYAAKYGSYLAEEVEVVGTVRADRFVLDTDSGGRPRLQAFANTPEGRAAAPFYQRSFDPSITDEIRIYGLAGADVFDINGNRGNIKVRVIGSPDRDSVQVGGTGKRVIVYNNPGDGLEDNGNVRWKLSDDTAITRYNYRGFRANSGHTIKFPSFTNTRGIHFNLGYIYRKYAFRKEPFSWEQRLRANYSISRKSFGGDYQGIFHHVIGKWSLLVNGRYDQVLKHYYFGVGNETKVAPGITNLNFYQLLTEEGAATVGLERALGKHHRLGIVGGYDMVRVLADTGYSGKELPLTAPTTLDRKHFGSAGVYYNFRAVNDEVVPTKGFNLHLLARHTQNINQSDRSFQWYEGTATAYFPFSKVISLVIHGGAASAQGKAEFYQLPTLGGGPSLRGYKRERFRGETIAFNQNELRFLWNFRSWLFNGKAGLIGFFDHGRVWQPAEEYRSWHTGFGAGVMLVPFNFVAVTVAYGITPEDQIINLRLGAKVF